MKEERRRGRRRRKHNGEMVACVLVGVQRGRKKKEKEWAKRMVKERKERKKAERAQLQVWRHRSTSPPSFKVFYFRFFVCSVRYFCQGFTSVIELVVAWISFFGVHLNAGSILRCCCFVCFRSFFEETCIHVCVYVYVYYFEWKHSCVKWPQRGWREFLFSFFFWTVRCVGCFFRSFFFLMVFGKAATTEPSSVKLRVYRNTCFRTRVCVLCCVLFRLSFSSISSFPFLLFFALCCSLFGTNRLPLSVFWYSCAYTCIYIFIYLYIYILLCAERGGGGRGRDPYFNKQKKKEVKGGSGSFSRGMRSPSFPPSLPRQESKNDIK